MNPTELACRSVKVLRGTKLGRQERGERTDVALVRVRNSTSKPDGSTDSTAASVRKALSSMYTAHCYANCAA
jgi:hypothetical protein